VALVVDELATNAMEHAGSDHAVSIEFRQDAIHGAVHDGGAGTLTVWPPSVDLDREGGWGLLVVQQLTASWWVEYHEHGKTVGFTIAV
jgi:anti-sigma regulatory factor (Ser/Thr protein kinase)